MFLSRRGLRLRREHNRIRQQRFAKALQQALRDCVPLVDKPWSELYTGHALRVGGSNEMRRQGVANDIHRRMGGWMKLECICKHDVSTSASMM